MKNIIFPLVVLLLVTSCATTQPEPSQTEVSPSPTHVKPLPTLAPSESPTPPETPTDTPIPSPELGPEQIATSIEQVIGRWDIRLMIEGENEPAILTFALDGTHSTDGTGGYHAGMNLGKGTFWFEGNTLMLHSEECVGPTGLFTCTASYRVYVAMADNTPGSLRFVAIDDPHIDRRMSLHKKTFRPAPPD